MQYVASLSYGKDSMAMLEAIKMLGWPLDRIITAEVWATDTIPADLPPMVEFKEYADKVIHDRYGICVEHYRSSRTYEDVFYRKFRPGTIEKRKQKGTHISKFLQDDNKMQIYGFPGIFRQWCNNELKIAALNTVKKSLGKGCVSYVGIASDEPTRIERQKGKEGTLLPLVEIGWSESDCRNWCEENNLLSPIYTDATRGGCWFCHNQGVNQLRLLRKNYPEYWDLMLKWDNDSPVTFKPDGHTVHDFELRFQLEDKGLIYPYDRFKWSDLDAELNLRWF